MVDSVKNAISTVDIQKSRLSMKDGVEKARNASQAPAALQSDSFSLSQPKCHLLRRILRQLHL